MVQRCSRCMKIVEYVNPQKLCLKCSTPKPPPPHAQDVKSVLSQLNVTQDRGLTKEDAEERLHRYGLNELRQEHKTNLITLFLGQFASPLVGVLMAAILISFVLKEFINAAVISGIIILNAAFGFVQEFRAEKAIESLQKLTAPRSKVLRDGKVIEVESRLLVPGDILLLETGDKIAADARIVEALNLQAQEAALTGESTPVEKNNIKLPEKTAVADQENMLFAGTIVTRGRSRAVVIATGMSTEFGKIARLIQQASSGTTPLQKRITRFTHTLGIAAGIILLFTFAVGLLRGLPALRMLLTSLSLAVAIVPEGLPIVVTIALALGVQQMARRHALMRNLPSVETLGSVSVICTDKTGTLTHNEMTVRKLWVGGITVDVSGSGYKNEGKFSVENTIINPQKTQMMQMLLKTGMLCNNARLSEENGTTTVIGDPTEGALLVSAEKAGIAYEQLNEQYPRTAEIEFTSERKRMTTLHKFKKKTVALSKGAPDVLLKCCSRIYIDGKIKRLSKEDKERVHSAMEACASQALRILGFAYKEDIKENTRLEDVENDMIFLGMQAMIDPPREEVKSAIEKCKSAGIKVVMITGDHKTTAVAIAKELGIEGEAMTGEELQSLSVEQLKQCSDSIGVIARVDPEHKMKIVEAFKAKGYIVAMTGDGVNDAPALKNADIGIAMGITGTDVAKEASAMVLADDNFTSIVNAVEEGRTIFDNIRIFLKYLLAGNSAELISIFIALLIGLPLPLLVLQILWINVVTETIPAIALSKEPPQADIMARPPRKQQRNLLNRKDLGWLLLTTVIIGTGSLGAFYYALSSSGWAFGTVIDNSSPPQYYLHATTIMFTALVLFQMFNVFNNKAPRESVFFRELVNNPWLLFAISISVLLQVAIVQLPFFNAVFSTTPLTLPEWLMLIAISSSILWIGEIVKFVARSLDKSVDG